LSQGSFEVGLFYFRQKWYPGAIDRFKSVLKDDPAFSGRDGVYFYLAESLLKTRKEAEALPYFGKLVEEFQRSVYLTDAQKRILELKAQSEHKQAGG
jgi:outer membrane protein assembly factor BamD (BamD/ComL family)